MISSSLLEIGSKFGDYTVVKLLGKGAMGEVYKIADGDAVYALKIMKADLPEKWPVGDPDARPIKYIGE